IRFFTGNSILGTGWRHSFAADDAEPSHHFAQESPQPGNLINLVANAYNKPKSEIASSDTAKPYRYVTAKIASLRSH
ncbi:MAG TPA: hypothetical protein VK463_02425, partial [Desulfomonilaceae bacterium]|nr:hypothetical protein [Desulfomonilaceae bacterium]